MEPIRSDIVLGEVERAIGGALEDTSARKAFRYVDDLFCLPRQRRRG